MAQRAVVEKTDDDLDGSEAEHTVVFALDGVSYEINLNEQNANALRELFAPYVQAGRKVGGRGVRRRRARHR